MARSVQESERSSDRLISRNRRVRFDYQIEETFEAGLVLMGSEVKMLREGHADLTDAWVDVDARNEAWVKGMRIPVLTHAAFGHEEKRVRKLMLHAEQVREIRSRIEAQGMTAVVVKCYFRRGRAKLEIALARGRKKHDKRQVIREREDYREAREAIRRVHRS